MGSFHHLLMKSYMALHKRVMSDAAGYDLTAGQPKILEFLSDREMADQKSIAGHCEIEPATVGSILSRMEESGLIVRERIKGNRRSVYVSLTEKGKQAAEITHRLFSDWENVAFRRMSEGEKETLRSLLEKVYLNLRQEDNKNL